MRSRSTRGVVLFAILVNGWLAVGAAVARPPVKPIVLQFREAPVVRGPHEHTVSAVAFSPDSKTLATGDSFLRLWDCETGRLKSVQAEDAVRGIHNLAFSPDGQWVAAVGGFFGRDVVVWDVASGQLLDAYRQTTAATDLPAASPEAPPMIYQGQPIDYRLLTALAFSPDGRILATAPGDVVLCEPRSGRVIATLKHPAKGVKTVAFSPDGKTLVTAGDDKKVRLWNVSDGALMTTLDGPAQPVISVAFAADGKRVVATCSGHRWALLGEGPPASSIWTWDRSSEPPRQIELGSVRCRQAALVTSNSAAVAVGKDLLLINLGESAAARSRQLGSRNKDLFCVAASPDGRMIASGGADRTVEIVDSASGKLIHRLPGLMDSIASLAVSSDGRRFATATIDLRFSSHLPTVEAPFAARLKANFSDLVNSEPPQPSQVRVWSTADGRMQALLPIPESQVTAIAFVPDGDQLVVAGWLPGKGGMLALWDAAGRHLRDFAIQSAEVLSIAVSPDGRTLASGTANGKFELWNISSGEKLRSQKYNSPIEAIAFSADGKQLATGDGNRTVRLSNADGKEVVRTLESRSYIESLAFSPDGTQLAAGTRDPGLELWNLPAGTASRTLKASGDHFDKMPGFVAFSPNGRFVVCGGHGKDIAVFAAATGKLHGELSGHFHAATAAIFLPDGRLLSGAEERTVRLWNVDNNQLLATWIALPADRRRDWDDQWLGFTPSGSFVGSPHLDRLVGWLSGGDFLTTPEPAGRLKKVEAVFEAAPPAAAKD